MIDFSSVTLLTYLMQDVKENTHCEINVFIWKGNITKSETHTCVLFSWILTKKKQQNVTSWRGIVHCWIPSPDTNPDMIFLQEAKSYFFLHKMEFHGNNIRLQLMSTRYNIGFALLQIYVSVKVKTSHFQISEWFLFVRSVNHWKKKRIVIIWFIWINQCTGYCSAVSGTWALYSSNHLGASCHQMVSHVLMSGAGISMGFLDGVKTPLWFEVTTSPLCK